MKGKGSGNTGPDWVITGDHTVKLRAERSGKGDGRVYTISVQAEDEAGNLSEVKTTTVIVPHDQGKGKGNGNNGNKNNNDHKGNQGDQGDQGKDNGSDNGKGNGNGKGNNGNGNGKKPEKD